MDYIKAEIKEEYTNENLDCIEIVDVASGYDTSDSHEDKQCFDMECSDGMTTPPDRQYLSEFVDCASVNPHQFMEEEYPDLQFSGKKRKDNFVAKKNNKIPVKPSHRHKQSIIKYKTRYQPYTCASCKQTFRRKCDLIYHIETQPHGLFICYHCEKSFTCKSHLELHIYKHIGIQHKCQYCNMSFQKLIELETHKRMHTTDLRNKANCGFCNAGDLKKYILLQTDKPIIVKTSSECYVCGTYFDSDKNLVNHLMNHTKKRHIKCFQCHAKFASVTELERHAKYKHQIIKEKKFPHTDKSPNPEHCREKPVVSEPKHGGEKSLISEPGHCIMKALVSEAENYREKPLVPEPEHSRKKHLVPEPEPCKNKPLVSEAESWRKKSLVLGPDQCKEKPLVPESQHCRDKHSAPKPQHDLKLATSLIEPALENDDKTQSKKCYVDFSSVTYIYQQTQPLK